MTDPADIIRIERLETRLHHLERANELYAREHRRLNELLTRADALVAASIVGNGLDFARNRTLYLDARKGPA